MKTDDITKTGKPDYTKPHCSGSGCEIKKKCKMYYNKGEPAALWARRSGDGKCTHFSLSILHVFC